MPASYNRVILAGNLTRDPETRHTSGGKTVAAFGLAVNRKTKGGKEDVVFVDCQAWERTAEVVGQYLSKGSAVLVEGRLHLDQWEDRNSGQKRSKLGVTVESLQMLGGRAEGQSRGAAGHSGGEAAPGDAGGSEDGDDVPF